VGFVVMGKRRRHRSTCNIS